MASGIRWHGNEVAFRVGLGMQKNLTKAAIYVQRKVKESLTIAGPTKTHPKTSASAPGEPPHRRTGTLARSIAYEVTPDTARVGTNVKYGKYLETGTSKMAARPYLRPVVYKNQPMIKKILAGKIR